jgi:hypothetical protein
MKATMIATRRSDARHPAVRCAIACACVAAALSMTAHAAGTRVYRCQDAGRVTYSDQPCANGRVVEVDGGAAAPDATERLRRDQQALDARATQLRDIRAREEAVQRMAPAQMPPPEEPPSAPYYYDAPGYGYGVWNPRQDQARDRRQDRRDDRRDDRDRRRERHIVVTPPPHLPSPPAHLPSPMPR